MSCIYDNDEKNLTCWAVVAHAFYPSTREAEAGGFLSSRGQPGLQSEFQHSQDYTEQLCVKKQTNKQTNKQKTQKSRSFFKGI